ncbi:hypothetical protein [Polyangium sp. 15x6]|uniref:hypothetical protein n=1 Tax=Polyangium sp. 15x6 TaxID=3042687 RepID=UPI00249C67DF|nr:hypothetical protein [Polyangium sp. 15x6]MDI3284665.1 hypothetical protein [Polyangium sp. 15x6]
MTHVPSFFRPLAVALCLAFAAAPTVAFAGEGSAPAGAKAEAGKKKRVAFPIPADQFTKHMEKRIEKARGRMESHMKAKNLPEADRVARRKAFDASATEVRAAAKRVAQDGTVTKEEAKEVRKLAKGLKPGGHKKGRDHAKKPGKAA